MLTDIGQFIDASNKAQLGPLSGYEFNSLPVSQDRRVCSSYDIKATDEPTRSLALAAARI